MKLKVTKIYRDHIEFEDNFKLFSDHIPECCENHYLSFENLELRDFDGLEFDLSDGGFFNQIKDYGIELRPIKGFPIRIPGYASNNGYYSDNLSLCISNENVIIKKYDITECQCDI